MIFTFGYGQVDPLTGRSLASCYVVLEDDPSQARTKMLERFGNAEYGGNWAFDYIDEEAAGVGRYALTRIDFDTGDIIRQDSP